MGTIQEIRSTHIDDQNYQYIDVYFTGDDNEEGETAAMVCRDTHKVIWLKPVLCSKPEVKKTIDEVLETIPFSISDTWTVQDVLDVCEELIINGETVELTEEQAIKVLKLQQKGLDTEQGINYYTIQAIAEEVWIDDLSQ